MLLVRDILVLILAFFGCVLNSMLAALLIYRRRKLLERKANKLLLNLAISDAFVSFSIGLIRSINYVQGGLLEANLLVKIVFAILVLAFVPLTIANLILLTVDRMFAIKAPFTYANRIRDRHVYFCIIGSWLLFVIDVVFIVMLSLKAIDAENPGLFLYFVCVTHVVILSVGVAILTSFNLYIFFVARQQRRSIERQSSMSFVQRNEKRGDGADKNTRHTRTSNKARAKKEYRLVQMTVGLVLVYVVCWTPYYVTLVLTTLVEAYKSSTNAYMETFAWVFFTLNYLLDPLLYTCLSWDVKGELKRLFRRSSVHRKLFEKARVRSVESEEQTTRFSIEENDHKQTLFDEQL